MKSFVMNVSYNPSNNSYDLYDSTRVISKDLIKMYEYDSKSERKFISKEEYKKAKKTNKKKKACLFIYIMFMLSILIFVVELYCKQ